MFWTRSLSTKSSHGPVKSGPPGGMGALNPPIATTPHNNHIQHNN